MKSISFWNMGSKQPFGRVLLSSNESHAIAKYISQLEAEIERMIAILAAIECAECGAKSLLKCTCPDGYLGGNDGE